MEGSRVLTQVQCRNLALDLLAERPSTIPPERREILDRFRLAPPTIKVFEDNYNLFVDHRGGDIQITITDFRERYIARLEYNHSDGSISDAACNVRHTLEIVQRTPSIVIKMALEESTKITLEIANSGDVVCYIEDHRGIMYEYSQSKLHSLTFEQFVYTKLYDAPDRRIPTTFILDHHL